MSCALIFYAIALSRAQPAVMHFESAASLARFAIEFAFEPPNGLHSREWIAGSRWTFGKYFQGFRRFAGRSQRSFVMQDKVTSIAVITV